MQIFIYPDFQKLQDQLHFDCNGTVEVIFILSLGLAVVLQVTQFTYYNQARLKICPLKY